MDSIQCSALYAGVCTHLRVCPLRLDFFSHLLRTAQQVIALPALQVVQRNKQTVNTTESHSIGLKQKQKHTDS